MAEAVGIVLLQATGLGGFAGTILFGTTTVATVVGSAALIGGSLVGAALLGSGQAAGAAQQGYNVPNPSDGTQNLKQPIPPRIMGFGRCRLGGAYMLYDGSEAGYSYDVIALHQGKISVPAWYYLNDDLVTLDSNGTVIDVVGGEAQTATVVTISNGTPATINWSGSNLDEGQAIWFTATGTMPTGLVAGRVYYAWNATAGSTQFTAAQLDAAPLPISGSYTGSITGRYSGERRYTGLVRIKTRQGEDTETAYSEVTAALPRVWSADHRGDGIASALLICQPGTDTTLFKSYPRGLPKLSVVADLTAVFDPRDVAQSRADPTTWTASQNPVLQLLHYLTDADRGMGLDWDSLIEPVVDDLMDQADICDETVTRLDGTTEPRYRSSGWFYLTTDHADVIASILSTCDGWMAEAGDGTLSLIVGKYTAPTVTITDDHIHGFSVDHGVADEEAVNEIKVSYCAPDNDYREAPARPWRDETAIAEAGRIRTQQLSLPWVQSYSQARRLAKRAMLRHQATLRGTLTTSMYGMQALGHRWIRVQSDIIDGLSDAVVEVTSARIDLANARLSFDWALVNPNEIDAWDETTEEGDRPGFVGKLTDTQALGDARAYDGLSTNGANAFDGSETTFASGAANSTGAIGKYWNGETKRIWRFVLKSRSTRSFAGSASPRTINWVLQGSQNGSAWTDLATGTVTDAAQSSQKVIDETVVPPPTAYAYHRVRITTTTGVPELQVAELQLYQVVDVT